MKKSLKYIIILIITCIIFLFIYNNHEYIFNKLYNIERIDTVYHTDTLYRDTTITVFKDKPVPKYIEVIKVDTFYKNGKDTLLKTENKLYQDTFTCAKDSIIIQNFISGINSRLDSTKVDLKKQETIVTNTVEITKYIEKKKTFFDRFHLGVQAGYGYGFAYKGLEPYVGVGGSFDL